MNELDFAKSLFEINSITEEQWEKIVSKYNNISNSCADDSVQTFLDEFKKYLCSISGSENTVNNYYNNVRGFLAYLYGVSTKEVGGCIMKNITATDINQYLLHKFNNSEIRVNISSIKNAMRKLVDFINETQDYKIRWEEVYNINLVTNTLLKTKQDVDYVSEQDVHSMVDRVDEKAAVIILLSYEGALKRNELLNMRISDIDIANETYSIRDKDGNINRTLKASDKLVKVLKEYLMYLDDDIENSNKVRQANNSPLRIKSDYLLQTRKSDIPSLYTVYYSLEKAITKVYKKTPMLNEELKQIVDKFKNENLRQSRILHYYIEGFSQTEINKMTGGTSRVYNATYKRMADEIMNSKH